MIGHIVIGYGNLLRGDDGAGPAVVALVGARDPALRTMTVPMLMPELAPLLAEVSVAVFVDARVGTAPGRVRVEAIDRDSAVGAFGHLLSASTLVGMAHHLYDASLQAFHVSVDAACFDVGADISAPVAKALPLAANTVLQVLDAAFAAAAP